MIYAGEPVWAGIVGRIAGERLPAIALVGAGLIVAAVIVSELKTKGKAGAAEEELRRNGVNTVEPCGSEPAPGDAPTKGPDAAPAITRARTE